MKNYEYCFVTKRSPGNVNDNLLYKLITGFPEVLFFTTNNHICYLSETEENMVGEFISKPWKNKQELKRSIFKCYKLPEYRKSIIIGSPTSFVYSSFTPEFRTIIKEPNYIGYLGGRYFLSPTGNLSGYLDPSESCSIKGLEDTMSRAYDLLRNEDIIS